MTDKDPQQQHQQPLLNDDTDKPGVETAADEGTKDVSDPAAVVVNMLPETPGDEKPKDSQNALERVQSITDKPVKVTVYVHVRIKLGEIDTVKETFTADVIIQARWREPKLDGFGTVTQESLATMRWDDYWNPQIFIENTVGEPKRIITHTVFYNTDTWEAYIVERRRVRGTFLENLELLRFPFDTQDITIKILSDRSIHELVLEDDPTESSTINVESFVDEQEWRLYNVMKMYKNSDPICSTEDLQDQSEDAAEYCSIHPWLSCRMYAARRPGFYITNILIPMFLVCSMAFATFSVDHIKRENRIQLSFIILLTAVTFKFAVSNSLPRISYLTTMDMYIMTAMSILIVICIWHAIIPKIDAAVGHSAASTGDTVVVIVLGLLYFILHILFTIFVAYKAKTRWQLYEEKERQYKEKLSKEKKARLAGGISMLQDVRRGVSQRQEEEV